MRIRFFIFKYGQACNFSLILLTENLKMRPGHSKTSSQNSNKEEDDLEWVEKNFPATVVDK